MKLKFDALHMHMNIEDCAEIPDFRKIVLRPVVQNFSQSNICECDDFHANFCYHINISVRKNRRAAPHFFEVLTSNSSNLRKNNRKGLNFLFWWTFFCENRRKMYFSNKLTILQINFPNNTHLIVSRTILQKIYATTYPPRHRCHVLYTVPPLSWVQNDLFWIFLISRFDLLLLLLGLAKSPYETSTVCPSVSDKKFSYFPSLLFSENSHEVRPS